MAMCTTIVAVRKKNIRHLYYGEPIHMVYRTSADYPNLQQLKLLKDDKELRESILKAAKRNYNPKKLEPAPAYRVVTASELDGIVKRLYYNRIPKALIGLSLPSGSAPAGGVRKDHGRQPTVAAAYAAPARNSRNPAQLNGLHKSLPKTAPPQTAPAS